jgi:hypothetical protein
MENIILEREREIIKYTFVINKAKRKRGPPTILVLFKFSLERI